MYYSNSKNCNIIYDNSENILNDNNPCLGTSVDDYCCQSGRNHCATGDIACSGCSSGGDCLIPGCWQWDGTTCTQSVYRLCTSAECGTNINEVCMGGCNGCPSESKPGKVYTCPPGSYSDSASCSVCYYDSGTQRLPITTCEQASKNTANLTWCYDETDPSNTTGSCAPLDGKCPSGLTAAWTSDDVKAGNEIFASKACACLASNGSKLKPGTCQAAACTTVSSSNTQIPAHCTWCYGVGADSAANAVIKSNGFFPGKIYPSSYPTDTCPHGAGISFAKSEDPSVCCEIGSGGAQTKGDCSQVVPNSGSCDDIEGSQCNWCYGGEENASKHHGYAYPAFTEGTTPSDCDGGPITEHQHCCKNLGSCCDIKDTVCDWMYSAGGAGETICNRGYYENDNKYINSACGGFDITTNTTSNHCDCLGCC